MLGICLLVVIRHVYFQNLSRLGIWNFGLQSQRKFTREESGRARFYPQFLGLFFVLNTTFLAYLVNQNFHLILNGRTFLVQFLFFFTLVLFVLVLKWFLNKLIATITGETRIVSEYNHISSSTDQLAGLLLFPLIVLNAFSEILPQFVFITSLCLLGFMLLLKWSRGFVLGLAEERVGILQILAYFCALEILPQLIVVKYIVQTF